jgi:hypothetical protein
MKELSLTTILDVAIDVTGADRTTVLSRSRTQLAVDARCIYVHLSRRLRPGGQVPTYARIGTRIDRRESDTAHLAKRAENLMSRDTEGHSRDFKTYLRRAVRQLAQTTE